MGLPTHDLMHHFMDCRQRALESIRLIAQKPHLKGKMCSILKTAKALSHLAVLMHSVTPQPELSVHGISHGVFLLTYCWYKIERSRLNPSGQIGFITAFFI